MDTDGEHVLINTALGRAKTSNIERDPRVALAIADQSDPYHYFAIRGRVVRKVTGKRAEDHIDKMAKKYLGKDRYDYHSPDSKRIILMVKPDRVLSPQ